ncbi:hypothetical protein E3N88_35058 [Mikania micrantha]|uniref:Uncharacterized protein n=1 Tax=Mikania micrantha TaxID=192012 RepID=A0A5N6M022_9ASTR|nr:hypothetical protein E3N88_35058 [Mikania micrantha]
MFDSGLRASPYGDKGLPDDCHYGGVVAVDVTDKGLGVALQWTPCVSFNTVSAPVIQEKGSEGLNEEC